MKFQLCAWIAKMKCLGKEGTNESNNIETSKDIKGLKKELS